MNLHNHALSAVLQNGSYAYIPHLSVWVSLMRRVEPIPSALKCSIMKRTTIFHSTVSGYEKPENMPISRSKLLTDSAALLRNRNRML